VSLCIEKGQPDQRQPKFNQFKFPIHFNYTKMQ